MLTLPEDRTFVIREPGQGEMKAGGGAAAAAKQLQLQVVLGQSRTIAIAGLQVETAVGIAGVSLEHHPMAQGWAAKVGRRRHQRHQIGGLPVFGWGALPRVRD
jgi:hypothetical protein